MAAPHGVVPQVTHNMYNNCLQVKDAVTGASFSFDTASLQHNVRFGDLQSITGAQVDDRITHSASCLQGGCHPAYRPCQHCTLVIVLLSIARLYWLYSMYHQPAPIPAVQEG
jgi:hypothetical protein